MELQNMEYFTLRLQCSREDKLECLQTVQKLSNIVAVARKEGFLAVEPIAEQETNLFFKTCLLDVLDGLDGDSLKKLFHRYLVAGNYRGKDFLNAVLITEGLLCLYVYRNLEDVWTCLKGFFGADFANEYREAFRLHKKKQCSTENSPQQSYFPAFDNLTTLPLELRDRLFREAPIQELATALKGAGDEVVHHLCDGLSEQNAEKLEKEMDLVNNLRIMDVVKAQKALMERVERWKD